MNKMKYYLWICFSLFFILSGCDRTDFNEQIESIQIIESTVLDYYDIDDFNLSDIEIQITRKNGLTENISLHEDMLDDEDIVKLLEPGSHTLTVRYFEHEITFVVTMRFGELKTKLLEIYQIYDQANVSDLTYDQWIASIKGEDGTSIVDAVVNESGHLILTLCDDSTIDAGYILGQDGIDGKEITIRIDSGYIQWKYIGEDTWTNLIEISLLKGEQGIGIASLSINQIGELIITYTDLSTQNLGQIYHLYTVQFKDDDGYVIDTQLLAYGEDAVAPIVPDKEGHLFIGWDVSFTNVINNLIVTATYEKETYTVTFHSQGSTDSFFDGVFSYGSTIDLPIPEKDGYAFVGWYRSNLVTASPFYNDTEVKSNLDLYARWEAIDYKIEFIDDDDSILSTQYIKHHENVIQPVDPIRLGYTFLGWYLDQTYTNLCNFSLVPTKDMNIYAKWELDVYHIEYVLNDGVLEVENPSSYTIHSNTIVLGEPNKDYYEFIGWYDNELFIGEPIIEISAGSTGNYKLYAKFEIIHYIITYDLDGGENNELNQSTYTIEDGFINLNEAYKDGYNFDGWYTYVDGVLYHLNFNMFSSTYASDITLCAHWELIQYSVIYVLNGGTNDLNNPTSFTILSESLEIFDATRSGCIFHGWYDNAEFGGDPISEITTGSNGSIYLYAKWEVLNFSIEYVLNGGINSEDNIYTYSADLEEVVLYDPTYEGYSFLGWYDNATFENEPISYFDSGLGTDITLYAKWELITYTIVYVMDGGTNHLDNPTSLTFFSENLELHAPTKFAHKFVGWFDNDELDGYPITEISLGTELTIYIYAKWSIYFDIIYHLDDGINHHDNPLQITYYDNFYLINPVKFGYDFLGWYHDDMFTGDQVYEILIGTEQDINLYAKWELTTYHITYHLEYGTNHQDNPDGITIFDDIIYFQDPLHDEGYIFLGWYDDPYFLDDQIIYIDPYEYFIYIGSDIDLYAKWEMIQYDITYHLYGGYNDPNNPASYTVLSEDISIYEPYKQGYHFLGWYDNSEFLGVGYSVWVIYSGSIEHIELHAKWELAIYNITYISSIDANNEYNPESYHIEMETISLYDPDPLDLDYRFEGWYENSDFTGEQVIYIWTDQERHITLNAYWVLRDYVLEYDHDTDTWTKTYLN
ncbi:MAG: InlB B-repeat-containing protein [Tenericutes bacterium]|nr:InlB B-repeat-containing protein [Mycoplasmatota bacterium]